MNRIVLTALALALVSPLAAFSADPAPTVKPVAPARHGHILAEHAKANLTPEQAEHLRGVRTPAAHAPKALLNTDTSTPVKPSASASGAPKK